MILVVGGERQRQRDEQWSCSTLAALPRAHLDDAGCVAETVTGDVIGEDEGHLFLSLAQNSHLSPSSLPPHPCTATL